MPRGARISRLTRGPRPRPRPCRAALRRRRAPSTASSSGASQRSGPGPASTSRSAARAAPVPAAGSSGARRSRPRAAAVSSTARMRLRFADRRAQLSCGSPGHRHVVLLHRAGRQRVDARRGGQPAVLGHHGRLRVLGDHQARVQAGVVGQERRQALRAAGVEQAVGPALGDGADRGDGDRQKVARQSQRRAVEVAARLDAAVGEDHRVVDRRAQLGRRRPTRRERRHRGRRRSPGARTAASTRPGRVGRRGGGSRRSASRPAAGGCCPRSAA